MLEKLIVVQAFRTSYILWKSGIHYGDYMRQSPNSDPIQNNSFYTHTLKPSILCLCLYKTFIDSASLKLDLGSILNLMDKYM